LFNIIYIILELQIDFLEMYIPFLIYLCGTEVCLDPIWDYIMSILFTVLVQHELVLIFSLLINCELQKRLHADPCHLYYRIKRRFAKKEDYRTNVIPFLSKKLKLLNFVHFNT
jgi:hypothetical protein